MEAEFLQVLTTLDSIGEEEDAAWHYMLVVCLCLWTAGEPLAADDALEAAWFPVADLGLRPAPLIARVAEIAAQARPLTPGAGTGRRS